MRSRAAVAPPARLATAPRAVWGRAGLLLALLAGGAPAWAQEAPRRVGPVYTEPLRARDDLPAAWPASPVFARGQGGGEPSATFLVDYEGFPPEARVAFQAAVDTWARFIRSDVPIRITARWRPLGANILGAAGPFLVTDFAGAPAPRTWYAYALADALAGRDLFPGEADIQADFNSSFGRWHLDPATPPPPGCNCYDLATVVLHELGHGLGFIGSLDIENGLGVVGAEDGEGREDGIPFAYDRFTEDADGDPLLAYPDRSAALAAALRDSTFFAGPATRAAHGDRAPLYTPALWVTGTSYSHLDEGAFQTGTASALMTPFFVQLERIPEPDALACAVLMDTGWAPGPGCEALVPVVPPPTPTPGFTLALAPGALNPFRAGTAVRLTVERRQRVQVGLYDVAGRRVAVLFDRTLPAGGEARVPVPGGLPAGAYVVRADGDAFTGALLLTQIR